MAAIAATTPSATAAAVTPRETSCHPRQLEIVPEEAAIVRRIWAELVDHSLDVARPSQRRRGPHRGRWPTGHATRSRTSSAEVGCTSASSSRSAAATNDPAGTSRSSAKPSTAGRWPRSPPVAHRPEAPSLPPLRPAGLLRLRLRDADAGRGPPPAGHRAPLLPLPDGRLPRPSSGRDSSKARSSRRSPRPSCLTRSSMPPVGSYGDGSTRRTP